MKWNYLLLEVYCDYDQEIYENVPCCKMNPGEIGILCFNNGSDICKHCGFKSSRSTIALTDSQGNVIQAKSFSDEDELDEKEWIKKEKEWCNKWGYILEDND